MDITPEGMKKLAEKEAQEKKRQLYLIWGAVALGILCYVGIFYFIWRAW